MATNGTHTAVPDDVSLISVHAGVQSPKVEPRLRGCIQSPLKMGHDGEDCNIARNQPLYEKQEERGGSR